METIPIIPLMLLHIMLCVASLVPTVVILLGGYIVLKDLIKYLRES